MTKFKQIVLLCYLLVVSCEILAQTGKRDSQDSSLLEINKILSVLDSSKLDTERLFQLEKAYTLVQNLSDDTARSKYLSQISYEFYKLNDSARFRRVNRNATLQALQIKDTNTVANLYWDLGNFFYQNIQNDSAYYYYNKAQLLFQEIDSDFYTGRMLINKAIVQTSIKDYVGSEISTFKALELLEPLQKYNQLYRCYNNLGIIYNELEEYAKSLEYHERALDIQKKVTNRNFFEETTLNNIGVVEENRGNYIKAKTIFKEILTQGNLLRENPKLYAMVLDNFAYNSFKSGDTEQVYDHFIRSLEIRDSIKDYYGITINKLHLSEYFLLQKDTISAIAFAQSSYSLAKETQNFKDRLSALLFLSKADPTEKGTYLQEYIALEDSLQVVERRVRNKFTRIAYETDQFIFRNKELQNQKALLTVLFVLLAFSTVMVVIILHNRAKNKTLVYQAKQQKANEEIYALMLAQQSKLEEGRQQEKHRIAGELHDGVLSNLFGLRLSLGSLNKSQTEEAIKLRAGLIEEIRQLEEEIRNISHELSQEPRLNDIGFIKLVERLVENKGRLGEFEVDFYHQEDIQWYEVDNAIKMNIYRLVQESLQNIIKHARARKVWISFTYNPEENQLEIDIKDNGLGFDQEKKISGIGLSNMKSRIDELNGFMKITSNPGNGTEITFHIPLIFNS